MSDRQALIARLRREYEKWSRAYHRFPPCDYSRDGDEYASVLTQHGWLAWQASSLAATALEEAQGVPREPTPEMLNAVSDEHANFGDKNYYRFVWTRMYDAAPAAPTREPLTDEMLRYAMAAMGTGSPEKAQEYRRFWRFAMEAAAPTREPVSAAVQRDERDARRWRELAIRLASPGHVKPDRITVDIEVDGKWIVVIEEFGDIFCHIVEPAGIDAALAEPKR